MKPYRKIAQSLLLVAGLGAMASAPAMAGPDCGGMGSHREHHEKMMEQHHKQLHDALKLTPEQEPGWNKLMESEHHKPLVGVGKQEDWAKLKTPERAEKMLDLSKARQTQMEEHVEALKAFYAQLKPEQQKVFDDFHMGPRGGMRGKPAPRTRDAAKAPGQS